jgi:hypothetical protein
VIRAAWHLRAKRELLESQDFYRQNQPSIIAHAKSIMDKPAYAQFWS